MFMQIKKIHEQTTYVNKQYMYQTLLLKKKSHTNVKNTGL